jgi:oligosaccharyl transferase (archaeosortase A-associated)
MSTETETDEGVLEGVSLLEPFQRYYHVPVLVVLVAFMLWLRVLPAENFIRADGIYFNGNDAWYHLRETTYTVYNWPFTMPFDPWTQYPYGVSNSQFGTLYDQLVATAALILGLGDPSQRLIAKTLLYAPAVFGAATAIPIYVLGKRLSGRLGGLVGVTVLAFLPGAFLQRTTAGFADHSAAAVFFHAVAVLGFAVALRVAEREKPVYELVLDRDWDGLREPTKYGVLAGLGVSLYIWTWPPGIVLVGIIGTFFLLTLGLKYALGRSPDHIAYLGVVSMLTVFVFSVLTFDEFGFRAPAVSLLHLFVTFGVAAGAAFIAWLARTWDDLPLGRGLFPASTISIALVAVAVFSLVLPDAWGSIQSNLMRTLAIGQTDTTLTIGEAQARPAMGPRYLDRLMNYLVAFYGLTFITGFAGLCVLVYRGIDERARADHFFVLVWTVFLFMMAITQSRFHTYLVLPIAVLNAYFVGSLLRLVDVDRDFDVTEIKTHHVSVALAAVILVIAPIAPIAGISMTSTTVHAQNTGAPGNPADDGPAPRGVATWDSTTDWYKNGTPEIESLDKYGRYANTDDFAYDPETYGIMSWWDYGHWITVRGDRLPHANPFQAGARTASRYFLYENETRANLLLDALPSLGPRVSNIDSYTPADYREMIADQTERERGEDIRYVSIDYQMATGKFGAIAQWSGPPREEYYERQSTDHQIRSESGTRNISVPYQQFSDRYEETMLAKLYWDNADGLEHYRLVHTSSNRRLLATYSRIDTQTGRALNFQFMTPIGQVGSNRSIQTLFALQQRQDYVLHDVRRAVSLKTFERVEGARLTGEAPAGANVTVSLRLNNTQTGSNFTYEQRVQANEDGEFVVTVPYATNDAVAPEEGGTDSLIAADGIYTVNVEGGGITTVRVPESAVLDGEEITLDFEGANASITGYVVVSAPQQSVSGGVATSPPAAGSVAFALRSADAVPV